MKVTGIVLAGGRARRFGRDKLAATLDGRTVLAATIAAVAPLTDGVAVAGSWLPDASGVAVPVVLFRDPDDDAGPLAALANVLGHAERGTDRGAIVVGGDMPFVVPGVLAAMLHALERDAAVDGVLLAPPDSPTASQRRQVLPMAVRVDAAAPRAAEAVASGERSLRSFVDRLVVLELPSSAWLPLDPGALTLADIDTPADLERLRGGRPLDAQRS